MGIRLELFGGLRVLVDDAEHPTLRNLRSRLAFLAWLAVERHCTRDSAKALFWPESSAVNASHSLRQTIYQIRGIAGDDWLDQSASELRATASLSADVAEFRNAMDRSEWEVAGRLYAGPFMDGVHVIDGHGWTTWVDAQRAAPGSRPSRAGPTTPAGSSARLRRKSRHRSCCIS